MENGIRLTALSKGRAEAELSAGAAHTNFMGTVHGGALYTLCDVAGGCALIERGLCVTLDAAMTYLRPVKAGKVRAAAERIKAGISAFPAWKCSTRRGNCAVPPRSPCT